jgi:hypothetical protein
MIRKLALVAILLALSSASVLAAPRNNSRNDSVRTSAAAPGKSNVNIDTSKFDFGLGVTTIGGLSSGAGVSSMFEFSELHAVQLILGLGIVGGGGAGVEFGGATGYKFTLVGDRNVGFHVGGMLNFAVVPVSAAGSVTLSPGASHYFGMSIQPLLGFHFRFLEHIGASVDFGPRFYFITTPTVFTGFDLRQFGSFLGLSAHYFF